MATVAAFSFLGAAPEMAAEDGSTEGPASFKMYFHDALATMTVEEFVSLIKVEELWLILIRPIMMMISILNNNKIMNIIIAMYYQQTCYTVHLWHLILQVEVLFWIIYYTSEFLHL